MILSFKFVHKQWPGRSKSEREPGVKLRQKKSSFDAGNTYSGCFACFFLQATRFLLLLVLFIKNQEIFKRLNTGAKMSVNLSKTLSPFTRRLAFLWKRICICICICICIWICTHVCVRFCVSDCPSYKTLWSFTRNLAFLSNCLILICLNL